MQTILRTIAAGALAALLLAHPARAQLDIRNAPSGLVPGSGMLTNGSNATAAALAAILSAASNTLPSGIAATNMALTTPNIGAAIGTSADLSSFLTLDPASKPAGRTASPTFYGINGIGYGVFLGTTGSTAIVDLRNLTGSRSYAFPDVSGNLLTTGDTATVTNAILATMATNTVKGNATSGTASPTDLAVGSCSASGSALQWTTNTGFGCNTSINAATLGGATFAAPGAIGGGTPAAGHFTTLDLTASNTLANTSVGPTPWQQGSGTITITTNRDYTECTSTCSVVLPAPVSGAEHCVRNANNVSTVITLAGIASVQFEVQAQTSYKTANTSIVGDGTVTSKVCYVGNGTTKYDVGMMVGTWT